MTKKNIKGKINKNKLNYTFKDVEKGKLKELFPEQKGKSYHGVKQNRVRITRDEDIPDRLPTAGLYPYPIDEDDFIGEYESKKNIYLTLAHAYNKSMKRIKVLEQEIQQLKSK